jgi:hypothetical protein
MFGGICAHGADAIVYATFDGSVLLVDLAGPRVAGQFSVYPSGPPRVHVSACAVAGDGSILVADARNQRVRRFAPDGRQLSLLGGLHNPGIVQQDAAGILDEPCAVRPLGGEVLVACGGLGEEHGVQVFDREGAYRRSLAAPPGGWKRAQGLAEVEGSIWVAETEAGTIRVHAPDGAPTGRVALHPELRRPFRVKADGYGGAFLLVAPESDESDPFGVARIARDGTFDGWTVRAGEEPGEALSPFDVAVLPDGRFVVADLPYGRPPEVRLQLFSTDGRLIEVLFEDTADVNAGQRAWFEELLARPERDAATLYEQARVHHYYAGATQGHLEEARDLYAKALEADPTMLLARLGLATLLHRGLGDPASAEAHYRKALEAGGSEGDMLARIAECRHDAGDLDGAIGLLRKAIEALRPPEGYHELVEELADYYLEREA